MARQVAFPTRTIPGTPGTKGDQSKFALGGAILGGAIGALGGPGAALKGAATGASLGGIAGQFLGEKPKQGTPSQQVQSQGVQAPQPAETSAMQRRLEAQRQNRLAVLRRAEAALPELSPDIRAEIAPTIIRATMMEEKIQRGGRL